MSKALLKQQNINHTNITYLEPGRKICRGHSWGKNLSFYCTLNKYLCQFFCRILSRSTNCKRQIRINKGIYDFKTLTATVFRRMSSKSFKASILALRKTFDRVFWNGKSFRQSVEVLRTDEAGFRCLCVDLPVSNISLLGESVLTTTGKVFFRWKLIKTDSLTYFSVLASLHKDKTL